MFPGSQPRYHDKMLSVVHATLLYCWDLSSRALLVSTISLVLLRLLFDNLSMFSYRKGRSVAGSTSLSVAGSASLSLSLSRSVSSYLVGCVLGRLSRSWEHHRLVPFLVWCAWKLES